MFRWIFTVLITVLLAGCSIQQDAAKPAKNEPVAAPVTQVSGRHRQVGISVSKISRDCPAH